MSGIAVREYLPPPLVRYAGSECWMLWILTSTATLGPPPVRTNSRAALPILVLEQVDLRGVLSETWLVHT